MLRVSLVVFTALLRCGVMRKWCNKHQLSGLFLVVVGLLSVGGSELWRRQAAGQRILDEHTAAGILLVTLGSFAHGLQNVLEEWLMRPHSNGAAAPSPLEVTGWEGLFGVALGGAVMLPIVSHMRGSDCGHIENWHDTVSKIYAQPQLLLGLLLALGTCTCRTSTSAWHLCTALMQGLSGVSAEMVTKALSSTHRSIVSALSHRIA
jgi:hypothetical protein